VRVRSLFGVYAGMDDPRVRAVLIRDLAEPPGGVMDVAAGRAVVTAPGEWVRYSTPHGDTEYIAVCLPAFSPATVHREA